MKLPTRYDDDMLRWREINYPLPEGESRSADVSSLVYPPVGFFPFYYIGNGDEYGFYWPVGKEGDAPLVASMSHDAASLIPEHSSVESMYQCRLACCADEDDYENLRDYRELLEYVQTPSNGAAPRFRRWARRFVGRKPKRPMPDAIASDDFTSLLKVDPSSPYFLCAAADVHVANDEFEEAEQKYRASLAQCPDYVAAHFGLAGVLQDSRPGEATVHCRKALLGTPSLYGGSFWKQSSLPGRFRRDWHRKSLTWLQKSAEPDSDLSNDSFLKIVDQLRFSSGMAEESDLRVLDEVVDRYVDRKQFADAAKVWQTIGQHARFGPANLMKVLKLTPQSFGERLAELFRQSGNQLRSDLVSDMLERMKDPEDQYL